MSHNYTRSKASAEGGGGGGGGGEIGDSRLGGSGVGGGKVSWLLPSQVISEDIRELPEKHIRLRECAKLSDQIRQNPIALE